MEIPNRYKVNTSSFQHYWTKGAGVKLLKKLDHKPSIDDAKNLIPYLYAYDESADKLVNQLHLQVGFVKGQQLIKDYLTDPKSVLLPFKDALDTFFKQIDTSPSWLNWNMVEKGIEVCQRSGLSGLIVLRDYCLMWVAMNLRPSINH